MKKMKYGPKTIGILLLALIFAMSLCFTACGDKDDEEVAGSGGAKATKEATRVPEGYTPEDFEVEEDPYEALPEAEKKKMKKEAKIKNKDVESFYGTWVGDEETAYNLYGNIVLTINKDGTFDADLSDGEEVFSGTWTKADDGINYTSELMSGKLYFGEYCQLTIDNSEWDYDDEDSDMVVTLSKKD